MSTATSGYTSSEWQARVNLAALYRLFAHFGWTDLTYTHISARIPDEAGHYLINPYGLLFEEVTASGLLNVDFEGNVVKGDGRLNRAGHGIHTGVLRARPEINFVLHSHTRSGGAVSAMRCGLLPISQHANVIMGTLAYHRYGVVHEDREEGDLVASDLKDKYLMLLQNHGLLACGRTAGEALLYHYFLEMACSIQVDVLRSGTEWIAPPEAARAELAAWGSSRAEPWGGSQWAALIRMLERKDPTFKY